MTLNACVLGLGTVTQSKNRANTPTHCNRIAHHAYSEASHQEKLRPEILSLCHLDCIEHIHALYVLTISRIKPWKCSESVVIHDVQSNMVSEVPFSKFRRTEKAKRT